MSQCEVCDRVVMTKASIIRDYYYQHICNDCYLKLTNFASPSSGQASWNRSRDAEDNESAMIQPYSGGDPSKEFIHLYPERAKQLFTEDEIRRAVRS